VKNLGIVSLILIALFGSRQSQARVFDYALQPSESNPNIRHVIFRVYDRDYVREIDTREEFNTIGTDIWVPKGRTQFLLILNIAWIENGTNSLPQKFTGNIDLDVFSSTNETPATRIGARHWNIKFDPKTTAAKNVPFIVSRSMLDEKRSVYFCLLHLLVPVHPALDSRFPKDISIWMAAGKDLIHYQIQEKDYLIDSSQNPVDFSMESGLLKSANSTSQPLQTSTMASTNAIKSEITSSNIAPVLEISLRDGFVLINSLPPVTNGVLEEANPNSYPLKWQPAIESSNMPSGWELPLTSGSMLFRARMPDTSP
jgi:hypothetical protein